MRMRDQWGIGGFRGGGEKPNSYYLSKLSKKKLVKKSEEAAK